MVVAAIDGAGVGDAAGGSCLLFQPRQRRTSTSPSAWGCHPKMACRWRRRFLVAGVDGLHDEPRPGAPRSITDAQVERVIVTTLEQQSREATHWSTRSLADGPACRSRRCPGSGGRSGCGPHLVEACRLSPDPLFIDKVRAVVGLYLDPPDAAVVLCVDEKTQVQALDRTAPVLPMLPGTPQRLEPTTTGATAPPTSTPRSMSHRGT